MAAAVALSPPPSTTNKQMASTAPAHSCPNCGENVDVEQLVRDAQKQIRDLEAQVEFLKEKATAAVDKCADYEDQLRTTTLNRTNTASTSHALLRTNTSDSLAPSRSSVEDQRPSTAGAPSLSSKQSRFSFLTSVRRGSPGGPLLPFSSQPPSTPTTDPSLLSQQLEAERALRAKAEDRARKVDIEIEELSVQLFSQANEMVASERKARAKLEARVELLEKMGKDKAMRLERLERAVSRIDRVKQLLAAPGGAAPPPKR